MSVACERLRFSGGRADAGLSCAALFHQDRTWRAIANKTPATQTRSCRTSAPECAAVASRTYVLEGVSASTWVSISVTAIRLRFEGWIGSPERVDSGTEDDTVTQKITPFLWFDDSAEEATNFYVSIFKNSEVLSINRYGEAGPGAAGTVMSTSFGLDGQEFMALNGGPHFKFTEAVSFFIDCKTQDEVDGLWEKLSDGGETSQCGWLKDKFGLSWQVIPSALGEMLGDKDRERANRVMQAMLQMTKIDIAKLKEAYDQE